MIDASVRDQWRDDGYVVLPAYLSAADLASARAELEMMFPTASAFHEGADSATHDRFRDEFAGIDNFPFKSTELSLVAVHDRLIDLAESLLHTADLRAYSIEAWAKYTAAADYEQSHHRDYLNHTLLVPSDAPQQVEMFLYLDDVPDSLGPPRFVPRPLTQDVPALPNWYPRGDGERDPEHADWVSPTGRDEFYDAEVSAAGPAGTVVAYRIETFHRGTALTAPRGARYTIHVNFRDAAADWITRRAWTDAANTPAWQGFVTRASPRQLQLFGFPPPDNRYWTDETLRGMALRYPGFNPASWRR